MSHQSIERVEKVVKNATAVSRSQLLLVFFQVYKIFNFRSLLNNRHKNLFSLFVGPMKQHGISNLQWIISSPRVL